MLREKSQSQDVDASLFRVIVDQFLSRSTHPPSDIVQFERLALGLMEGLDAETIAPVAQLLCLHLETPESVTGRLLDKGGECARIAFEFARNVAAADLLATAEYGPVEFAAAIARRADLGRTVVSALVSRPEAEVLRSLAANKDARLDRAVLRVLVLAGRDDLTLGRLLLDRRESHLDIEPLFLAATRIERAAIMLEATRCALMDQAPDGAVRTGGGALAAALEGAALAHDREGAAEVIADALDCRKSRARTILSDQSGEALALVFLVLGIGEEAAARLLSCADPRISSDAGCVRSLVALMRFIPLRAAKRIVTSMTGAARTEREPPRRHPHYDFATLQPNASRLSASARNVALDLDRGPTAARRV
jgi:uncharacterized protein (DUF2336 family)